MLLINTDTTKQVLSIYVCEDFQIKNDVVRLYNVRCKFQSYNVKDVDEYIGRSFENAIICLQIAAPNLNIEFHN